MPQVACLFEGRKGRERRGEETNKQ